MSRGSSRAPSRRRSAPPVPLGFASGEWNAAVCHRRPSLCSLRSKAAKGVAWPDVMSAHCSRNCAGTCGRSTGWRTTSSASPLASRRDSDAAPSLTPPPCVSPPRTSASEPPKAQRSAHSRAGRTCPPQGIEHLSLGSTKVGALLLVGLFFYDIFWVRRKYTPAAPAPQTPRAARIYLRCSLVRSRRLTLPAVCVCPLCPSVCPPGVLHAGDGFRREAV